MPCVGRDAELALLGEAVRSGVSGNGRLVLVAGEAGIGKSRLVEEAAVEASALGAEVVWGRCWEAGGAPAYWPWIEALRELAASRGDALPPARRAAVARIVPELGDGPADSSRDDDAE